MSRDIFLKHSSRDWSRGGSIPTGIPAPTVSGSGTLRKAALGTMALGTFTGLAFITSPWWKPEPRQPTRPLGTRRMYLKTGIPSGRITWSRR